MSKTTSSPHKFDEHAVLRTIVQGTSSVTGEAFFKALVENLAQALHTNGAWVTEYVEETRRLRALAFLVDGKWNEDFEYDIDGTLCEEALEKRGLVFYPDRVIEITSRNFFGAVSYLGAPLLDVDGKILGHMAVIDTKPMSEEPDVKAIFQIFAARAAAELQRLQAEAAVREREERLHAIVHALPDIVFVIGEDGRYLDILTSHENLLPRSPDKLKGHLFHDLFPTATADFFLASVQRTLETKQSQIFEYELIVANVKHWFEGRTAPLGLTINSKHCIVMVSSDITDRKRAEKLQIENLSLQEEIKSKFSFGKIIGESKAMKSVFLSMKMVSGTDASVLITGETGTGKELIARAIHGASHRKDEPLITVNCAAVPAALIESEFFGHEKGAFTGATASREGRFALADGGTIFLDEVGELPLDLQSKLLRVLQEGMFEPVGSSHTRQVDVRVIAATHRNLLKEIHKGNFREDLYYRLHVFPIELPPLRDRGDDIVALATFFAQEFARKMRRTIQPLSEKTIRLLKSYDWPGNIRELQNVIERAGITSQGQHLDLEAAFPNPTASQATPSAVLPAPTLKQVLTVKELQQLERENLLLALESTGWRVSGEKGAAQLLDMNPFTLNSRIKALGIKRPGT